MKLRKLKGRHIASNTYVVENEGKVVIIDAGAKLHELLAVLEDMGSVEVSAILLTHSHFDHVLHLKEYIERFDCSVYVDKQGIANLGDSMLNASELFRMPMTIVEDNILPLPEKNISIGGMNIEIIRTFGHTNDSVCYVIGDVIFTGDTIFADGVGRVDLPTSNANAMEVSLAKLQRFSHMLHCPGHGDDF